MSDDPVIGIDLGTTNSCVAIYLYDRAEMIINDVGSTITPSYVAYTKDEVLVGDIAKEQASYNYENTIFDVKRLIGKRYKDKTVQNDIKTWPFNVTNDNGKPSLSLNIDGRKVSKCPEEISAEILRKLKDTASKRMETEVTKAVITVPAYFNDSQRQATKDAAKLAGLEVLRLLNEPTAAAIAYALDKKHDQSRHALVFDLGGGTFDVSIIKFEKRHVTVIAIDGDTHLGGDDLDNRLVQYLTQDIKKTHGYDISGSRPSMARLRSACEKAKRTLSFRTSAFVQLDYFVEGKDYQYKLSKARFEDINEDLFNKMLKIVEKCISDANLSTDRIDNVVLVGGSTRIPYIQNKLKEYFKDKPISNSLHPEEAVAMGAAIYAANLCDNSNQIVEGFVLKDVIPLTLGVETAGGFMNVLIKRNTPLPATGKKSYTTAKDNQAAVSIKIFEGERPLTQDNNLLGELRVTGILPAKAGAPVIDETFFVDENGILSVTAVDLSSGKTSNLDITLDKGRLSKLEIDRMIKEAEIHRNTDAKHWKMIDARNELESYCNKTLKLMKKIKISVSHRVYITNLCQQTLSNLTEYNNEDEQELVQKLKDLQADFENKLKIYK